MSEMSAGSVGGAGMSSTPAQGMQTPQGMQGGPDSLGAMRGEMPGIQGMANKEASSMAGRPPVGNQISNVANAETNINVSGDNNLVQINSQTTINQEIEINIMSEYQASGMGSQKMDKMFEELMNGGLDLEVLKKILEVIQQKQLEELIKLLVNILQGSGGEMGGIVNAQG